MTITLNITLDLETEVRQAADKAGIAPADYIADIIEQHLHRGGSREKILSKSETALLQQVNLGLSSESWQRYHALIEKRRAEILTPDEQKTLIQLTNELEMANARRMSALVKLAQHRRTSLDALMDELGIKAP